MFEKVVRGIQGVWGLESQRESHCIGLEDFLGERTGSGEFLVAQPDDLCIDVWISVMII